MFNTGGGPYYHPDNENNIATTDLIKHTIVLCNMKTTGPVNQSMTEADHGDPFDINPELV